MQISYEEATSSVGWVLFFGCLASIALVLLLNGALWAAKRYDTWRTERRRHAPYRNVKLRDP